MTATIIDIEKPTKVETPTGIETPKGGESKTADIQDPRQIYNDLCKQEKRAIDAIRGLRAIKKELREEFAPEDAPKFKQLTRDQFLRHIYGDLAQNFLTTLRGMNVTAIPCHIINPIAVRCDGVSGDGTRQITEFLYFPDHASETPVIAESIDEIPDDAVLFAEQAIGYTTVKLEFEVEGKTIGVIGKTICSANDDYNGNLGVILALKNAFEQIEARKIDTPLIALGHLIAGFQDMAAVQLMG